MQFPPRGWPAVRFGALAMLATLALSALLSARQDSRPRSGQRPVPPPRFASGIDIVDVTVTVVDERGRFVSGLEREDFLLFDNDEPKDVTQFSAARVPVSVGLLLDTSQSMQGEKFSSARSALERLLSALSSPEDEFFLMSFDTTPTLQQDWTADRARVARALAGVTPRGTTAMYDAVADAVPVAQRARNRKKALIIISDGNDRASDTRPADVRARVRAADALVYAVGIDCGNAARGPAKDQQRGPFPIPFPFPQPRPQFPPKPPGRSDLLRCPDPVDAGALRDLTDDSGGRTEIIHRAGDLDPVTSGIADELSRQYYLGYPASDRKDGQWHTIRVETRNTHYRVRARSGYIAS